MKLEEIKPLNEDGNFISDGMRKVGKIAKDLAAGKRGTTSRMIAHKAKEALKKRMHRKRETVADVGDAEQAKL